MNLVNIYATIIGLSDTYWSGTGLVSRPRLDLLISEYIQKRVSGKQIWMSKPTSVSPGHTSALLAASYDAFHNAPESYLALVVPGYADIVAEIPPSLTRRNLIQLHHSARAFRKRIVSVLVGVPSACPSSIEKKIRDLNQVTRAVSEAHFGILADLQGVRTEAWSSNGSRPKRLEAAAGIVAEAILGSHAGMKDWERIHGKHRRS